ncbi:MAG: M23 family metallopeptidase, partial [Syntrophomonas sp.]|nr:M23 family metallopeptidase [Syntrophomonas sp.]
MDKRWIGSLAVCIFLLALGAHPSVARLSEGNFIPFSRAASSFAESQAKSYQIQKGDTLCKISQSYNVSLKNLMLSNQMDENTILEVGDTLRIPTAQEMIHVVVPGDMMCDVADRYQVSMEALVGANSDKNPDFLEVGDLLYIPNANNIRVAQSMPEPSRSLSMSKLMIWPIAGTISSSFGWRKAGFHHGIDIANKIGTPIQAAAAGTVSFTGYKPVYGLTVIIDHPDGKQTLYAHTQKTYVHKG